MPTVRFVSRFMHQADGQPKRIFPRDWYGEVSNDIAEAAGKAGALEVQEAPQSVAAKTRRRSASGASTTVQPIPPVPPAATVDPQRPFDPPFDPPFAPMDPPVPPVALGEGNQPLGEQDQSLASFGTRAFPSLDDDGDDDGEGDDAGDDEGDGDDEKDEAPAAPAFEKPKPGRRNRRGR